MSIPRRAAFAILLLLCLAVIAYAAMYYLPGLAGPREPLVNGLGPNVLAIHVIAGSVALLLGPFQFLQGLRGRHPRLHHFSGRLYALGCVTAGLAGLGLAFGTHNGAIAGLGLGAMAIAWSYLTVRGVQAAIARNFIAHRRWMVRSFAVTLAAVTLRFELPAMLVSGLEFEIAYPLVSFLCWIPNLIAAEIWLAAGGQRASHAVTAAAGPSGH